MLRAKVFLPLFFSIVVFCLFGCQHEANKVIPDAERSLSGTGGLPTAESESATLSFESSKSPEFNLAKALQTQEEGFKKRDLKKAGASCEALNGEKLPPQLVSNMACRCFLVKLAAVIDSAASQKTQQTLCNGTTTAKNILDKKQRDSIPCENELNLSDPPEGKETLNKMILNLFQNGTDLDALKGDFAELGQQLQEIFPISDKIFSGRPQCSFPKEFFSTPKNFILKEGDIHYVLGYLKTAAAFLQATSQYKFNLNPKKIVKEVIANDGKRLKAIPAFLAADAGDERKTAEASPYDDDFIFPPNIMPLMEMQEEFDAKPFLALSENANFLDLKPLIAGALEHWVASAAAPKAVLAGMSEPAAKQWDKLKATLDNSWAGFDETSPQRALVNLHRLLEHPPHFGGIRAEDFGNYPNLENLRVIPRNFLRLGETSKKIREIFVCIENNGAEREVEYCDPPPCPKGLEPICMPKPPLCETKCESRDISTMVPAAELNLVAVFAALKEGLRINFEPQFNLRQIPNKICNNQKTEFYLDVVDLENDEVALTAPKPAQLPAGMEISPSVQGELKSFKIIVAEGTAKNKYKIFLGASDGKGPAQINRTMAPQGTFEKTPEVVQEMELIVDECPPELL